MKLTKAQREQLRLKYDGHCAYCGCELPERWHADHFEPCIRDLKFVDGKNGGTRLATGAPPKPERDVTENMMQACPPCNISKASMSLASWRNWLAGHVNSLNSSPPPDLPIGEAVRTHSGDRRGRRVPLRAHRKEPLMGQADLSLPAPHGRPIRRQIPRPASSPHDPRVRAMHSQHAHPV